MCTAVFDEQAAVHDRSVQQEGRTYRLLLLIIPLRACSSAILCQRLARSLDSLTTRHQLGQPRKERHADRA